MESPAYPGGVSPLPPSAFPPHLMGAGGHPHMATQQQAQAEMWSHHHHPQQQHGTEGCMGGGRTPLFMPLWGHLHQHHQHQQAQQQQWPASATGVDEAGSAMHISGAEW